MAALDWMVVTGAGPGIMEAGIEGAGADNAFGVSIQLPFETTTSQFIADDPKLINFRYFFTRKLEFIKESDAFVLLPGGYGTLDEAFELLTLLQTGKAQPAPVIMLDVPGGTYWQRWGEFVAEELEQTGYVSAEDHHLVLRHRQRRERRRRDPRLLRQLPLATVREGPAGAAHAARAVDRRCSTTLNRDFADIVTRGRDRGDRRDPRGDRRRRPRRPRPDRASGSTDTDGRACACSSTASTGAGRTGRERRHLRLRGARRAGHRRRGAGSARASALAFARAGAAVVVADVDEAGGSRDGRARARRRRGRALRAGDVASERLVQRMVRGRPSPRSAGSTSRTTTPASPPRSTTSATSPRRSGTACRA